MITLTLATGAAVCVLFSNAVTQILLGAALLAFLIFRQPLRLPPVGLPILLFVAGTALSLALSPDPRAGLSQIKKFYIYLILPVVFSAFRNIGDVIRTMLISAALSTASGLWSFVQFWHKRTEALSRGLNFYLQYIASRVTGFMSHWMTFSAEQMIAGTMLASLLMLGAVRARRPWLFIGLAIICISIVIAETRSVWLATSVAATYLIAVWRPRYLLLIPVAAVLLWFAAPRSIRERARSTWQPHGQADSNYHRQITRRVGVEMIRAHPWFGLGPEMPGREFLKYLPADITRPLPPAFYGHLHNVYLQYAAERGIPTLLAFLWFIGKVIADFGRAVMRLAPDERARRAVLHGALAAILGLLSEAFFEHNLNDSEVLTMFLVLIASGYVAILKADPARA